MGRRIVVEREMYEKAVNLLNKSNTLALSMVDEDGYPKIYPMEKVVSVNLDKVIFITKKDSNKAKLLNISNKCCIEVHTEDDMVLLKGNMEIHESEYIKKKSLPNDYIKRLERSGSERYCVLIFKTFQVDLYIDGDRCTSVIE
ncbi:Pyridoxamine 5'-phosphate oxidase [compost metagenome]